MYVLSRNMKNISFLSENFQFLEVKLSIYSVCVMSKEKHIIHRWRDDVMRQ